MRPSGRAMSRSEPVCPVPTVLGIRQSHFCFDCRTVPLLPPPLPPATMKQRGRQPGISPPASAPLSSLFLIPVNFPVSWEKIDKRAYLCVCLGGSQAGSRCLAWFMLAYWSMGRLCPPLHSGCQLSFLCLNISCWSLTAALYLCIHRISPLSSSMSLFIC